MNSDIAVLIPAYNAEKTIEETLSRIHKVLPAAFVLVVNDGSQDRTAACAERAGGHVLSHPRNRGKGAALQTGFDTLLSLSSIQYIITMDADLQHCPEDAPNFLRAEEETHADIVLGLRKRKGTSMPLHRRFSNAVTSWLVSARTSRTILDSQCGYRLIHRNVVEAVRLESTGFEAETEFLIKAVLRGFSVTHVPIQTVYGTGKSSMTNWTTTVRFLSVLLKEYA